jgi:regulator of RNase E activity RraB
MNEDYPPDADGDALRRVAALGNDMSRPMEINFQIAAPNELAAQQMAFVASKLGFRTEIWSDDNEMDLDHGDGHPWTCECSQKMVPEHGAIVAIQVELDGIARRFGAHADGWGTFGNLE